LPRRKRPRKSRKRKLARKSKLELSGSELKKRKPMLVLVKRKEIS
jgi:hypothetical protein